MQTLEQLLRTFAKRTNARWWVGKRPEVREGQLAKAIAGLVGLPTSADDPFASGGMVRLNKADAAHVLAVAGATSLAHEACSPRKGQVEEAKRALDDFAPDAAFFSNGEWKEGPSRSWYPLTRATFDCGVIGFDRDHAFIFWVEEED
jgi:hypothetical protein